MVASSRAYGSSRRDKIKHINCVCQESETFQAKTRAQTTWTETNANNTNDGTLELDADPDAAHVELLDTLAANE